MHDIGPVAGALRFGAEPLHAAPREKWDYSYINRVLVAAVVERANNQTTPSAAASEPSLPARAGVHWQGESGVSGGFKTLLAYDAQDGQPAVLLSNTDMQQSERATLAVALFEDT